MKKILFLIFVNNIGFCQNVFIVDSINKQPLSFVNIYFFKGNKIFDGIQSDQNGFIKIQNKIDIDNIKFSVIRVSILKRDWDKEFFDFFSKG